MSAKKSIANLNISVIIPAYMQASYLTQTLDSVLQQTYRPAEIIVVDDGSPDETASVCAQYGERIRYVRKNNAGLSAARNTGILASSGDFLVWLDSDDYFPPEFLEQTADTLSRTEADVTYCDYHHVDKQGCTSQKFQAFVPSDSAAHQYLLGNMFPPHAAMTRRSTLANAGLFDPNLRSFEDWDMWIRLAFAGAKFVKTEGVSVPYRQHPESMSRNAERMRRCGMQVLEKAKSYHPDCDECRRGIRAGQWGLRKHFLSIASRHDTTQAVLGDPSLVVSPLREAIRRSKWRLLEISPSRPHR